MLFVEEQCLGKVALDPAYEKEIVTESVTLVADWCEEPAELGVGRFFRQVYELAREEQTVFVETIKSELLVKVATCFRGLAKNEIGSQCRLAEELA
jgi:hypothetical protein